MTQTMLQVSTDRAFYDSNDAVGVTAILTEVDNGQAGLAGQDIEMQVFKDGTLVDTQARTTNSAGIASFLTIMQGVGNYAIYCVYEDSNGYTGSSDSMTIYARDEPIKVAITEALDEQVTAPPPPETPPVEPVTDYGPVFAGLGIIAIAGVGLYAILRSE